MNSLNRFKTQPRDSVIARFMLGFQGQSLPAELADYLKAGLAGVAIYPRNFSSAQHLRDLTEQIRGAAGRPVLIGIDQEGGARFALPEPFTRWPSPAQLGRLRDPELVEQVARAMGVELRAAGCNLDFAPMLDLNSNPESPVTRDRSFADDPHRVAIMGAAFDRGLRAARVLSCAKHFPGHGDVSVDPHLDLPVYAGDLAHLHSAELVPFRAAIQAGVRLIMTAHILLPKIDPKNPASLSRAIVTGLLRRQMGFTGVILADDLGMGAIARKTGVGEAALETFSAGSDVAMLCHDWSAVAPTIATVRKAYEEGRFDAQEWSASLARIENACSQADAPTPEPGLEVLGCAEFCALAANVLSQPECAEFKSRGDRSVQ
jgi:beta-N-acetylhexosaminidase